MSYQLNFSPVFKVTLQRLCDFLSRKYSKDLSNKTKIKIRKELLDRVSETPYEGPICERLVDLGVTGYRQLLIGKHNTVIYRVDEENRSVLVLIVFDNRQSIEKLLSEVNLLV